MFAGHCPRCGRTVLLSLDDVRVHNDRNGINVRYRCPHGHELEWAPIQGAVR